MRRKALYTSAALLAVLLAGGAAAALPVRDAVRASQGCAAITSYLETEGDLQTVGEGASLVSVLGDSYASGDTLKDRNDRWVTEFAELTHATVTIDAIGMTGYVNGGYCGDQAFPNRAAAILATTPDLLVIQGGLNDWESDPAEVESAAVDLLAQFEDVPTVVLVGPTKPPARSAVEDVDAALDAAAQASGRDYVSALDWELEWAADGVHMTPTGHAAYAALLAAAIPE